MPEYEAPRREDSNKSIPWEIRNARLHPSPRRALIYVPDSYAVYRPVPLIIALHGKGQHLSEFEYHTQLSNEETNDRAIVVYPEGINLQWTGDPEAPSRSEVDDISFIDILIELVCEDYAIQTGRIYVVGFSNGGGLAALLAGDPGASTRIAAYAISSGAFYQDEALKEPLFSHPSPARLPVPILEFHGDSDPVEHYDGKDTPDGPSYNVRDYIEKWVRLNKCVEEPKVQKLFGGKVEKVSWSSDKVSDVVQHYKIAGFGHGWPTTYPLDNDEQRHGPTYFDATPIVLEFLMRFTQGT
ncbi:hypothetical protein LTR47_006646 [Exophiala xenobiotica]|nr:hypothetical protein LTR47_006646 [Exophiala xenobiotica]KAK5243415.1 hypothetical protein LTS06_010820 [Exophiala xenobiotica]KAK5317018.1 hypothetical protein LTR93_008793 [Exophiala xenobiotica]KAK5349012.1 hypothetical protein LTR61_007050 [Exophiala xenobiotica]KAK5365502.1 hypothetical protein LTR11_008384 [Exophiala xenobiotica]